MKLEIHRVILAVLTGVLAVAAPSTASAGLAVVNGNFEDTTARPALGGGWYGGVAPGWNGPSQDYSAGTVEGSIVANMQWASINTPGEIQPFYQDIGVLDTRSNISLTFDFGGFGGSDLVVAIYSGASFGTVLGTASYTTAGTKTITVANVPGGTSIRIGFWQGSVAGAAGLDNVSVSVTPSVVAVVNGNFEDTTGRPALGNGWYGGVAPGWSGPSQDFSAGTVEGNIRANMGLASINTPGAIEPIYQDIGVLDTTSNITLTFDFVREWGGGDSLVVAIYSGASFGTVLGTASYTETGTKTITVPNVPSGTSIRIGFWQGSVAGAAGLDNVSVSVTPPGVAVVNGDFEDITGRPALGGGWYGGVAPGWNGPSQDYSAGTVGGNIVVNMQWASVNTPGAIEPIYQDIGVLDTTSTITLTFDHGDFGGNPPLNVGIYSGASFDTVLGTASYTETGTQTITVANVLGGTSIRIGFWQGASGGAATLDNVAVSVTAVPEPSAALLGALGGLALLRRRRA